MVRSSFLFTVWGRRRRVVLREEKEKYGGSVTECENAATVERE